MGHWQTIDIVHLLNRNRKVAVIDCYLRRASHELNKSVHLLLVEGLDNTP